MTGIKIPQKQVFLVLQTPRPSPLNPWSRTSDLDKQPTSYLQLKMSFQQFIKSYKQNSEFKTVVAFISNITSLISFKTENF